MGCGASSHSNTALDQPTEHFSIAPGSSDAAGHSTGSTDLSATSTPHIKPVQPDAVPICQSQDSLPYWERLEPLPQLTSNHLKRRSSAGKLVVHQTEKQKQLTAEAKKKRDSDESSPRSPKRGSALPPLRERKSLQRRKPIAVSERDGVGSSGRGQNWKGSSGGEAWEVSLPNSHVSTLEEQEDQSIQQQMAQQFKAYEAARRQQEAAADVGWGKLESMTVGNGNNDKTIRNSEAAITAHPPLPPGPPPSLPRKMNQTGSGDGNQESTCNGKASVGESVESHSRDASDMMDKGLSPQVRFYPDSGDQAARDEVSCIVEGKLYLTNFRGVENLQVLKKLNVKHIVCVNEQVSLRLVQTIFLSELLRSLSSLPLSRTPPSLS